MCYARRGVTAVTLHVTFSAAGTAVHVTPRGRRGKRFPGVTVRVTLVGCRVTLCDRM
jgi:hypothetical protein